MRVTIVLCAVLGLTMATTDSFMKFAKDHAKQYKSQAEVELRRAIFEANYASMVAHNERFAAGEETWTRKVTPHYDQTEEEFQAAFIHGLPAYDKDTVFVDHVDEDYAKMLEKKRVNAAPEEWNWVTEGGVTSIKNQGQCGSCADFAVISIVETCFWQQTGELFDDLSEQHLLDCGYGYNFVDEEGTWGAYGCDGAWPQAYMDWLEKKNGGLVQTETSYPYQAAVYGCNPKDGGDYTKAKVTGQYNVWNTNEADMKELVYVSPMTTSIQASYLGDYSGGIYNDQRCCEQITDPNCKYTLNHEVTVVGYGVENGMDYWLVKNSWDTWFGEEGYFKIKRGTGHCGIGALHYQAAQCEKA